MTTRACTSCKNPISKERLSALPNATLCIRCKRENDDGLTIGYMSWEHKTAPTLITSAGSSEKAIRELHRLSRKGNHASLPLSSPKNPSIASSLRAVEGKAEFDSIRTEGYTLPPSAVVTNIVLARCHPNRPAVADGRCLACCLGWYELRARR